MLKTETAAVSSHMQRTNKLEQVLPLPLVNSGAYGIDVQEFLDEYYVNELGTAEQCAKKIQERVTIWLHE